MTADPDTLLTALYVELTDRIQRLLALNACIWHNWQIGAPSSDP